MTDVPPLPEPEFPPPTIQTLFADGVLNFQPSQFVGKFYLGRADPPYNTREGQRITTVAQVVMPIIGFVQTAIFFEQALAGLLDSKIVTPEQVEEIRKGGA